MDDDGIVFFGCLSATTIKGTMEQIEGLVSKCRVATPSDTVVHSECAFTFFTPFHEKGILVNLNTFAGTIPALAMKGSSGDSEIFLRIVKERNEAMSNSDKILIQLRNIFQDHKTFGGLFLPDCGALSRPGLLIFSQA